MTVNVEMYREQAENLINLLDFSHSSIEVNVYNNSMVALKEKKESVNFSTAIENGFQDTIGGYIIGRGIDVVYLCKLEYDDFILIEIWDL